MISIAPRRGQLFCITYANIRPRRKSLELLAKRKAKGDSSRTLNSSVSFLLLATRAADGSYGQNLASCLIGRFQLIATERTPDSERDDNAHEGISDRSQLALDSVVRDCHTEDSPGYRYREHSTRALEIVIESIMG